MGGLPPFDFGLEPAPLLAGPPAELEEPEVAPGLPEPDPELLAQPEPVPEELVADLRAVDFARAVDRIPAGADVLDAQRQAVQARTGAQRAAKDLGVLAAEQRNLGVELANLRAIPEADRTPDQQKQVTELETRLADLEPAITSAQQDAQTASTAAGLAEESAQRSVDVERERAAAATQAAEAAGLALLAKESEEITQRADARRAELKDQESESAAKLQVARDAYKTTLETEPEFTGRDIGFAVAAAVAEGLLAAQQRRPADFSKALAPVMRQMQSRIESRVAARRAEIDGIQDDLARNAQEQRAIEVETQMARAAALERIQTQIQAKAAQAAGTVAEAEMLAAERRVGEQRERAIAQANRAELDYQIRIKGEALKQAKTEAEIAKIRGETRRRGPGVGAGKKLPPGVVRTARTVEDIPSHLVTLPDGSVLVEFDKTKEGGKRGDTATAGVNSFVKAHTAARQLADLVDKAGGRDVRDFTEATRREIVTQFNTNKALFADTLAKMKAGEGLAASESDNAWGERMVGEIGFANKDTMITQLTTLAQLMEQGWRAKAPQLGIPPTAVEDAIAFSRKRSVSERDRRDRRIRLAPEVLTNPDAPKDEKLAALDLTEEHWKRSGENQSNPGQWILLSIQSYKNALRATDDPEIERAITDRLTKLREAREAETKAILELDERRRQPQQILLPL